MLDVLDGGERAGQDGVSGRAEAFGVLVAAAHEDHLGPECCAHFRVVEGVADEVEFRLRGQRGDEVVPAREFRGAVEVVHAEDVVEEGRHAEAGGVAAEKVFA